jgi:hypothetical protein
MSFSRASLLGFGFGMWAGTLVFAGKAVGAEPTPVRTPTPAPRLSGGFGRPRSTPAPSAERSGQALSDVVTAAKTSSAGTPEKSTLTIDNRSLVKNPSKGRVSTGRASPATTHPVPTAASSSSPAAAVTAAPTGEAPGPAGTEAEWKEIAARARKRVTDDKARVEELSAATKKLENDFYAWDDGQYRDRVIKPAWDRSRTDLETAKQELAEAEKDLADLPEKARKAGALPGWIRE